jgi:hypothetical protein
MALNKANFDPGASSKGSVPKIHRYASSDALATIMASGYFNGLADVIATGDLMYINSTAAADGGSRLVRLVNTANVITSVNAGGGAGVVRIPFEINATDLSAGTAKQIPSPVAGRITKLVTDVQVAIVTGGAVTVNIGATPVDGLSITVADAAPVGTIQSDAPTAAHASAVVAVGSAISIVPAAAFNGGGALVGYLEIETTT